MHREVLEIALKDSLGRISRQWSDAPCFRRSAEFIKISSYVSRINSKPKGSGEEGAPRVHPEISCQKVADFECRFPYDSYGKNRVSFGPFLGEIF